jgi:hypothetical protein
MGTRILGPRPFGMSTEIDQQHLALVHDADMQNLVRGSQNAVDQWTGKEHAARSSSRRSTKTTFSLDMALPAIRR